MRTYLVSEAGFIEKPQWTPNCWVNVVCPDEDDLKFLTQDLKIPEEFFESFFFFIDIRFFSLFDLQT